MASNTYIQHTVGGKSHLAKRSVKQGRKPSGLGKPILIRLYEEDEIIFSQMENVMGEYFNLNQTVREAVASQRSVYIELLKP